MNTDQVVRQALEDSVRELPCPEPDLDALVAAGQSLRIRRAGLAAGLAAVVALMLVGVSLLWAAGTKGAVDEPVPANSPTTSDATAGAPSGPVYLAGGLNIGAEPVDLGRFTAQFTRLAGGVVAVEADTNEPRVTWRSWAGQTKGIGWNPWPTVEPFSSTGERGDGYWDTRALRRDVVGDPLGDHVAWITQASGRGDLVVVRASTGEEVARTVIPGGQVEWLDIRSIDDRTVHLRRCPAPTPPREAFDGHPGDGPQSQDGCTYWVWEWPTGSELHATGHSWVEPNGTVIHDMTTDVWAVQRPNSDALSFITSKGEHLSDAEVAVPDRSEGGGLSPDGRFWYSPGSTAFVVTSTGEIRRISDELAQIGPADASHFAWTGATTVTVAGPGGVTTCDASTATCSDPTTLPATDQQGGGTVDLKPELPVQ
jgi:hypothetical protein